MSVSKVVSIEITDLVTRICEIGYNKKNPVVYKSIIVQNPDFSVEDGFIMDRPLYEGALKAGLESAGIKCKDVVFVLSSNKIINREVVIPEMKEDMIPDLIETERSEYFPMDTTGHSFAFTVIEKMKETKQQRIVVFAAPDLLIKNYRAMAAELDLKIVAIDYSGNAIYQWMRRPTHDKMEMYLQINEKNSMFTIMDNGLLELQRNMSFGVNTLIDHIRDNGYYGKEVNDYEALLKLKTEDLIYPSFVAEEEADPEDADAENKHILKARLTDAIRPLIGNVSSVLEYYNTKKRGAIMPGGARPVEDKKPETESADEGEKTETAEAKPEVKVDVKPETTKIYIGGKGADITGLKELIESEFNGIEIVLLESLPGVNIHKNNTEAQKHSSELIACIGAAYPSINFFKVTEKETFGKTLVFCIVALVLVIGAAVFIVLNGRSEVKEAEKRQAELKAQLTQLEAEHIEELEAEFNGSAAAAAEVVAMDISTYTFNEDWNKILDYIEQEAVSNMIVSSLTSTQTALTMNITVGSKEEAAKLLLQLKKIPYFESVNTNGIVETVDPDTGIVIVSLSVTCNYTLPVEAGEEVTE